MTVYGGAIRQVQIQPNLDRLAGLGLTINDVMEAGRAALALRGGGTIDTSSQRITLDAPPPAPDPQAIAQALVTMQDNMPITHRPGRQRDDRARRCRSAMRRSWAGPACW